MDNAEYPIHSDDWRFKTDADRRRWALEQVGLAMRSADGTVDEAIAMAQRLVDYVSSGVAPSAPEDAQPVPPEAEVTIVPAPSVAA